MARHAWDAAGVKSAERLSNVMSALEAASGQTPIGGVIRTLSTGELLYRPGSQASEVYVVISGRLRIFAVSEGGREVVFWYCGPGDLLGVADVFVKENRRSFAEARAQVQVLALPVVRLEALMTSPQVVGLVCQHLSERLRRARSSVLTIATASVVTRLAYLLTVLSEDVVRAPDGSRHLDFGYSQQDLAEMIGTSRQSVSEALAVLRVRGWIKLNRKKVLVLPAMDLQLFEATPP